MPFFSTYSVSSGPLEVGAEATRVFDSGPLGSVVDSQIFFFLSRRNRILKACFCGTEILKD